MIGSTIPRTNHYKQNVMPCFRNWVIHIYRVSFKRKLLKLFVENMTICWSYFSKQQHKTKNHRKWKKVCNFESPPPYPTLGSDVILDLVWVFQIDECQRGLHFYVNNISLAQKLTKLQHYKKNHKILFKKTLKM